MRRSRAVRAAALSLGITVALALLKLATWAATGSLAVLSQALDSLVDVVALGLVFFGVRLAEKPADEEHHYGHAKAENLVAFAQTLVLGGLVLWVAGQSVLRLGRGIAPVEAPAYALALLAASGLVDALRARILVAAARREDSDALRAGALNVVTDVATAGVAVVSLAFVRAGAPEADSIGALLVGAGVLYAAVRLGRRSVDVLMDRAPAARREAVARAAAGAAGVQEARRVRVRSAGRQLFADVTVTADRTTTLERAHDIAEAVEREIEREVPGSDVVVHVEPAADSGGLVERAQAAASKVPGTHEVHNVSVHAFADGGRRALHVTLHAKVPAHTSLAEAHVLSEGIERAVADELGGDVRVDSHIEPMAPTALGVDVTGDRRDLVDDVQRIALEEPDVVDCHEVVVTSSSGALAVVAHVRGRGSLPLARIHDASERIEKAVHAAHPEVGDVLIHFEPA
ncbi:MAG TPA: cation diffusion facilitator family transporter [Actinomycetota bacterium]|nr:cation diffusion facilitator family transporter [Actinomycetota bacterium]